MVPAVRQTYALLTPARPSNMSTPPSPPHQPPLPPWFPPFSITPSAAESQRTLTLAYGLPIAPPPPSPPRQQKHDGDADALPHARENCAKHLFHSARTDDAHATNLKHCPLCFCLVCDVPVPTCPLWHTHCMAYFPIHEWAELRRRTRLARRAHHDATSAAATTAAGASVAALSSAAPPQLEVPPHLLPPAALRASASASALVVGGTSGGSGERGMLAGTDVNGSVCGLTLSPSEDGVSVGDPRPANWARHPQRSPPPAIDITATPPLTVTPTSPIPIASQQLLAQPRSLSPRPSHHPSAAAIAITPAPILTVTPPSPIQTARQELLAQTPSPSQRPSRPPSAVVLHEGVVQTARQSSLLGFTAVLPSAPDKTLRNVESCVVDVPPCRTLSDVEQSHEASRTVQLPPLVSCDNTAATYSTPSMPPLNAVDVVPVDGLPSLHSLPSVFQHPTPTTDNKQSSKTNVDNAMQHSSSPAPQLIDLTLTKPPLKPVQAEAFPSNNKTSPLHHPRPPMGERPTETFESICGDDASPSPLSQLFTPLDWSTNPHQIIRNLWSSLTLSATITPSLTPSPTHRTSLASIRLPSRILLGHIRFWRPFCSHLSARLKHPLSDDPATISECIFHSDAAEPYSQLVNIVLREMGVDLPRACELVQEEQACGWLANSYSLPYRAPGANVFQQYFWESGEVVSDDLLWALRQCMESGEIAVRWQVRHYDGAANANCALSRFHASLCSNNESFASFLNSRVEWLQSRECHLRNLRERRSNGKCSSALFDSSCCCSLTAWIFLTPKAFNAVGLQSHGACGMDSPYAHLPVYFNKQRRLSLCRHSMATRPNLAPQFQPVERRWEAVRGDGQGGVNTALAIIISSMASVDGDDIFDSCYSEPLKKLCAVEGVAGVAHVEREEVLRRVVRARTGGNARTEQLAFDAILSSKEFAVSDGYVRSVPQPQDIKLSLRIYQLESLAWMQDQEQMRSISDPFWTSVPGRDKFGNYVPVHFCPLTGSLSRFPPAPVVGGVLAEEMGLGKTVIVISLILSSLPSAIQFPLLAHQFRPDLVPSRATLVICPASLLGQWEHEIETVTSRSLRILSWYGSRSDDVSFIADHDVVLTTYGILKSGSNTALWLIHWFRVVIDESTHLESGFGSLAFGLSRLVARRRWAVSGTPFGACLETLQATLAFIGVVPFAGVEFEVLRRVMVSDMFGDGGRDGVGQIVKRGLVGGWSVVAFVVRRVVMRHVKDQLLYGRVLIELPPLTGWLVRVTLDPEEAALYAVLERIVQGQASLFLQRNETGDCRSFNPVILNGMLRPLRTMADGLLPDWGGPAFDGVEGKPEDWAQLQACVAGLLEGRRVRGDDGGSKVRQLLKDVHLIGGVNPGCKFVVFTEFKTVQGVLCNHLRRGGVSVFELRPGMEARQRWRVQSAFTNCGGGGASALVMSGGVGGMGLTLTAAQFVVLFEVGVELAAEAQAVGRVHRIGQGGPAVVVLSYVSAGTVDERVVALRKARGVAPYAGADVSSGGGCGGGRMTDVDSFRTLFNVV